MVTPIIPIPAEGKKSLKERIMVHLIMLFILPAVITGKMTSNERKS
jgi:hypothetical protein